MNIFSSGCPVYPDWNMSLQCGIVGLPNVGKSTIFNALTKSHAAQSANYPFCTIDPNVGIVEIPDHRFDQLCELVHPQNSVSASVEFVDIAGLVKGASKGEGLGNAFLSHIRQVDAILHVIRCFDDENITHVSGAISPLHDLEIIETELILSDLEQVEKRLNNLKRLVKSGDKVAVKTNEVLEKVFAALSDARPASTVDLTADDKKLIKELALLTLKPVIFAANLQEEYIVTPEKSDYYNQLKAEADNRGALVIPICGKIESELVGLEKEDELAFLQEFGLKEPGLNRVIREVYKTLGYITFFTAGEKEVRAWTVLDGSTAPRAAGEIHSDIEHGFIRAEVTSFEDVIQYSGLKGAREAGKMRLEGKEYVVNDGDVIYFRFNV